MSQETEYETGFGIFEDHDQIRNMQRMNVHPSEDGMIMIRACEKCAVEVKVLVPWEEIYCVSKGLLPQKVHPKYQSAQWVYDAARSTMYPALKCSQCGYTVAFPMTPNEAERRIQAAYKGNVMGPGQTSACTALAKAFQQRAGAGAPQARR